MTVNLFRANVLVICAAVLQTNGTPKSGDPANRFEPAAFEFGVEQSVEWSLGGAAVRYQGHERWFPMALTFSRGAIFLPLKQTDLRAPAVGDTPLHFVQLAVVEPSNGGWRLDWNLFQIVQGELQLVGAEQAVERFDGRDPPDVARIDLSASAGVHVNDRGVPEYTVRTASGLRSIPIRLSGPK